MKVTRTLDEDLIKEILRQKEIELDGAKGDVDAKLKALHEAEAKRDRIQLHVNQLKGVDEVSLVEPVGVYITTEIGKNESDSTQGVGEQDSVVQGSSEQGIDGEGTTEVGDANDKYRFWKENRFNWRMYIPRFIEERNQLLSLEDIFNSIEDQYSDLSDSEKKTLKSTISGSLSILRGKGILQGYIVPGKQGAFYGLPKFFARPDMAIAKREYAAELFDRLKLSDKLKEDILFENEFVVLDAGGAYEITEQVKELDEQLEDR